MEKSQTTVNVVYSDKRYDYTMLRSIQYDIFIYFIDYLHNKSENFIWLRSIELFRTVCVCVSVDFNLRFV